MLKGKDFRSCIVSDRRRGWCLYVLLAIAATLTVACDKAQLLAPTKSTITVSAAALVLPSGGSTEVTASVVEEAGTPVQNGTTVRFSTTLGRVAPVEAQTRNGVAVATFFAESGSGVAEIRATSGAATGGTAAAPTNVAQVTIGAAAVETVSVRANPGNVGPTGGTVEIIATVVGKGGQGLQGVVVTFSADQGSLSASTATTDAGGEARTTLTTSQDTKVSATAGAKLPATVTVTATTVEAVTIRANPASVGPNGGTVELIAAAVGKDGRGLPGVVVRFSTDQGTLSSSIATTDASGEARTTLATNQEATVSASAGTKPPVTVKVTVRAGPIVSVTCSAGVGATCAGVQATAVSNTATVLFTVTKATGTGGSSQLRDVTIDFGDGSSQSLGNLGSGSTAVSHAYAGPSDATPRTYTATVQATDINGESASASTAVIVTPMAALAQLTARWTFSASVGAGVVATSYEWNFGDGGTVTTSGNATSRVYTRASVVDPASVIRTVKVTVRTQDGRSGSASEQIVVQFSP